MGPDPLLPGGWFCNLLSWHRVKNQNDHQTLAVGWHLPINMAHVAVHGPGAWQRSLGSCNQGCERNKKTTVIA